MTTYELKFKNSNFLGAKNLASHKRLLLVGYTNEVSKYGIKNEEKKNVHLLKLTIKK